MAVDRLQILCEVAARSAANAIPTQLAPATIEIEPLNVTVNNICHFFSEIHERLKMLRPTLQVEKLWRVAQPLVRYST